MRSCHVRVCLCVCTYVSEYVCFNESWEASLHSSGYQCWEMAVSVKWQLCVCVRIDEPESDSSHIVEREKDGGMEGGTVGGVLWPPHPHRLILTQPGQIQRQKLSSITFSGPIQIHTLACTGLSSETDHTHTHTLPTAQQRNAYAETSLDWHDLATREEIGFHVCSRHTHESQTSFISFTLNISFV